MEKIVSTIYTFLARVLIVASQIPGGSDSGGRVWMIGIALIWVIAAFVLLHFAVCGNGGMYNFYVKLAVGGVVILIVAHYAVMMSSDMDVLETIPFYGSTLSGLILIGALAFLVVNFALAVEKGSITIMIWASEFFFTTAALRIWEYITQGMENSIPSFSKVMIMPRVVTVLTGALESMGIRSFVWVIELAVLLLLMFVTVFCIFNTGPDLQGEWIGAMLSQVIVCIVYLIIQAHNQTAWRMDLAFLLFLLFCISEVVYLFIFYYKIITRSQDGCVGAFFVGVGGLTGSAAAVIAVDMARRGAMVNSLERLSSVMTWIYQSIHMGAHSNFTDGRVWMTMLGIILTFLLTAGILFLLFLVVGRVFDFNTEGAGMGTAWFRNCAILMMLPIMVYWMYDLSGARVFSGMQAVIYLVLQSASCMGVALMVSNIAPAIRKGFLQQLILVLVSFVCSVVVTCVLVPFILALL